MRWVLAAAIAGLAVSPALGAGEPKSPEAGASAQASNSVIEYPASFFAAMGLNTAYDMVLRVPGFSFDDGSAVRGFSGAAGNVLIDGQRPTSKTDDLSSVLARIPSSQVERVALIRGGAPGIDMQGKSVVANIIRRTDEGFSGVVSFGGYKPEDVPFDPQLRLEGTWRKDGRVLSFSLLAFAYHDGAQGNGPHDIFGSAGQRLDSSQMHNSGPGWQYIATSGYETPLFGGKFKVNLTLEDQPGNKFNIDDFAVAGRMVERDRQDQVDLELGQHYERELSSTLNLEVLGLEHVDRNGSTSIFTTATEFQDFNLASHGGEMIGRGIAHWRPSSALTVDAGGEFAYNWLSTVTRFVDNGASIHVPAADVLVQEKRGEITAKATWQALPSLAVEGELRAEQSTISSAGDVVLSKPLTYIKPRLLVTWSPDGEDQMRVRVEREVGQLDFSNLVANAALNGTGIAAGNPNLVPQRDWVFEAAYDRHFWETGVVSLTVRHLILQDVVDRIPVFAASGEFDEPGNIGSADEDDLVASFNVPLDRLGLKHAVLRGSGTWRFSQVIDPATDQRRIISGQHPLDAELHFSQDFPAWKLSWGIDEMFGYLERFYRFDEIDSNRTNDVSTVFVDYKPLPDLSLHFSVDTNRMSLETTRQIFGGPRGIDPLQSIDFQDRKFGVISFIRIRKTFG
jgi:hypothetical protein